MFAHYRDYHFLLTLSDDVAHFGLEHHESSDDRDSRAQLDRRARAWILPDLLPHEFVHSWNGKYRRPADLATPDYQQPMKDDLLWVYEGLTEYLGEVLTARSGLRTQNSRAKHLAFLVATYEHRPGRAWRPLQDTADSAVFLYNADADWPNWRRGMDFYEEGELLWLDVDATLRRLTNDQKSMNDFCRIFHGGPGGEPVLKTYTFDDIVATLTASRHMIGRHFFARGSIPPCQNTPIEAIENSGWKLVYNEQPNGMEVNAEVVTKHLDLDFSLGMTVGEDGSIGDVIHGGAAYAAGLGPGMKIVGVNGRQYSPETLTEAIDSARTATEPIQLIVANGAQMRTYSIDYHGGRVFPHLERIDDAAHPDYLNDILRPLAQ